MEACAVICRKATVALPEANFLFPWCQSPSSRAQNRHFCAFLPPKPSFSGISSTKSGFLCAFGLRNPRFRAFRAQNRHFCARERVCFWEWWVLSCILTFVVCLSNFYELFLLKLPLRVCRSVLAGALLPLRTCRSVAAVTWLPLSSYRGAAAGILSPPAECFATTGGTPPTPECYCHHRWNAATDAGGD